MRGSTTKYPEDASANNTKDNEIDHRKAKCNESNVLDVTGLTCFFYLVNKTVCLLQSITKLAIVTLKQLVKIINRSTVDLNRRWNGQGFLMQVQWSEIV